MEAIFDNLKQLKNQGFSLIEVVIALGIMSFAVMAILGMVPMGLSTLRESMNVTAQTHMEQTLLNEAYSGDPAKLVAQTLYFDESGQKLAGQTAEWFYKVRMALVPVKVAESAGTTDLPGQMFLMGVESRNRPVVDPNWIMTETVKTLYPTLTIHSAVLLQ